MPGFRNIWPRQPDTPSEASHPVLCGCCTHVCLVVTSEACREGHLRSANPISQGARGAWGLLPGVFGLTSVSRWPCWD